MTEAWIMTNSGTQFHFNSPEPEAILIEDIAHALSLICRFTGHVNRFYSVAEHSVRVSWWAEERFGKEFAREGLMHDSSEAYVTDVNGPLKRLIGYPYTILEDKAMRVIGSKFNFAAEKSDPIRQCDGGLYLAEKRDLFNKFELQHTSHLDKEIYPDYVAGWLPLHAEAAFLQRFNEVKSW